MRITGLGYGLHGLGYSDTDILPAGTMITFGVHSDTCGVTFNAAQDITDDLNNWTSQMMQINSVTNTWEGAIPGIVDVTVNATVKQSILGGTLRGQIVAALAAVSACSLSLLNNTLNVAPGSTSTGTPPPPTSPFAIPWSTTAVVVAGVVGLLVVTSMFRR